MKNILDLKNLVCYGGVSIIIKIIFPSTISASIDNFIKLLDPDKRENNEILNESLKVSSVITMV